MPLRDSESLAQEANKEKQQRVHRLAVAAVAVKEERVGSLKVARRRKLEPQANVQAEYAQDSNEGLKMEKRVSHQPASFPRYTHQSTPAATMC